MHLVCFFTLAPYGWKMRLCLLYHALLYSDFCMDMSGVNPIIYCYNIKAVVLPKCLVFPLSEKCPNRSFLWSSFERFPRSVFNISSI